MNGYKNVETYSVREYWLDDIVRRVVEDELELPQDYEAFRDMVYDDVLEATGAERHPFLLDLLVESVYVKPDWRELLDWTREAVANY